MDSDKYDLAIIYGIGMATFFWIVVMLMSVGVAYDHGKHVGRLEAAAPELAAEKEVESEK